MLTMLVLIVDGVNAALGCFVAAKPNKLDVLGVKSFALKSFAFIPTTAYNKVAPAGTYLLSVVFDSKPHPAPEPKLIAEFIERTPCMLLGAAGSCAAPASTAALTAEVTNSSLTGTTVYKT